MQFLEIEFGTPLYDATVALRDEVLRKPLGLRFHRGQMGEEYQDYHLVVLNEHMRLLGCLVLTAKGMDVIKMRQVAVDPAFRNAGIGSALVRYSEHWSSQHGYTRMILHARKTAVPFYKRMDYRVEGDEFTEVGIPHYKMYKDLQ